MMPTLTIKVKVILAFVVATLVATFGLYTTSRANYQRNVNSLGEQALQTSRTAFEQLSRAEVAKMQAVATTLVTNAALVSKVNLATRDELLAATLPLYSQLKAEVGITNFNYIDPNEKRILVVTDPKDPKLIGTKAVRFNVQEAARTKTWASGLGLGFHGLALRLSHPIYDSGQLKGGNLVGYLELGVEINSFTKHLKQLTRHEFALLLEKKALNEEKWAEGRAKVGLRDNWKDQAEVVVASNTVQEGTILSLGRNLDSVPDRGQSLGLVSLDGHTYIRSVFPVYDGQKKKIGAMFVLSDVTEVTAELTSSLTYTIAASVVLVVVLMVLLMFLLSRLVFRRLAEISRVATRVVGGDFETPIAVGTRDEIGRFSELLEQFRVVVVSLITETIRMQGELEAQKKPEG